MSNKQDDDMFAKGFGIVVALAALGLGIAAAMMNSERAKQLRAELGARLDDLGHKVDDLANQARHTIEEHRPEIEQTIERGKNMAVDGLDKMKGVVSQSADRATEVVQRFSHSDEPGVDDVGDKVEDVVRGAGDTVSDAADEVGDTVENVGQETRRIASDVAEDIGERIDREANPPGY